VSRTDRRRASQEVHDGQACRCRDIEKGTVPSTFVGRGRKNLRARGGARCGQESQQGHHHRRPHHAHGSSPLAHGVHLGNNDDDDHDDEKRKAPEREEVRKRKANADAPGPVASSGGDVMIMIDDIPVRPGSSGDELEW
jgi:hypothetical protein